MPFSIQWDNADKTIIYVRYERWSWDDFYNAVKESSNLSSTVEHQVDIIAHLVDGIIPKGSAFSHSGSALKQDNNRLVDRHKSNYGYKRANLVRAWSRLKHQLIITA